MNILAANELKVKGVSALEDALSHDDRAFITVRGKTKYVVLTVDEYDNLRECELERLLREAKEDIARGDYTQETVAEHVKRLTKELNDEN
ncbi:MAG: type II toxin-antitoxin system Phd/YefM family antitoxin [Candidatus Peregrinibacteria bacterium]|nr:type II toxin-antitoxin system Phd/YefM family antitoxin [Candidatus Peregrinibacteria bacterium]MDZ4245021.1 type II toxin-antitoxin system Phd/YefM family antitoxin [Candidatus Gracilibacteria bacterium]